MIIIKHRGNFNNTEKFFSKVAKIDYARILEKYGQEGVNALSLATPVATGLTADSWGYEIHNSGSSFTISWTNSNVVDGVPIVIILQYGHGTRNGGYVQGQDFINPAIKPIFDKLANEAWGEVTKV